MSPRAPASLLCAALLAGLLLAPGCGGDAPGEGEALLERLRAIPGLQVEENPEGRALAPGQRFFVLTFQQPVDHARPQGARFGQRLTLLHTSDSAPMVLYTSGYFVSTEPARRELTQVLGANQLSVEHRYFGPSRPTPTDWSLLTIEQAAADFHRLVEAFKPLYPGRWLATGGSKGGMTMVYFRRFHPGDVDGTLAYVAPQVRRHDERFPAFQEGVGTADCRARLKAFQQEVLRRRPAMLARLETYAAARGLTYGHLGLDKALEHAVIESYFYFWQYQPPTACDDVPAPGASDAELLGALDALVPLFTFSDQELADYAPYYFQSALELGYPAPFETHLAGLLAFPGTDVADEYVPRGVSAPYRPGAMEDVQAWLGSGGERVMLLYGSLDPWSAAPFALGGARDSHLYVVEGGNHLSRLGDLPEPQRAEALATLRRWAGLSAVAAAPSRAAAAAGGREPEGEEFGPHRPRRPLK